MAGNSTDPLFAVVSTEKLSYTGTADQSAAFASGIHHIRIVATSDCHYAIGANPTATANDTYLPADTVEKIRVNQGEKISVVQNSAGGDAFITSLSK
jgi:hypothetical protein|tara:strand:- start:1143 stop:1433 length:291 start_codon:yes stop_codon:yes gene_type:complete